MNYVREIKYLSKRYDIAEHKIIITPNSGVDCIFMEGIFAGYADKSFIKEVDEHFLLEEG